MLLPEPSGLPVVEPVATEDTRPFWEAATEGRLVLPRCRSCGTVIWYPRPVCPSCHGDDVEWIDALGTGRIHTYTVVRRAMGAWRDAVPYVLAYVELAEGPLVMSNVVGDGVPDHVSIDAPVQAAFEPTPEGLAVLRFRLA